MTSDARNDRVVRSVDRCRPKIVERYVRALQQVGSPLVWDSVMLEQVRAQAGRVLDDTVAALRGGPDARVAERPDPAAVEIGTYHARHRVHLSESLRAGGLLFETALDNVVDDLGDAAHAAGVLRVSLALNDSISRRLVVAAKAYFITWLDQVHNTHSEQRLRVLRELTDASRDQLVSAIHLIMHEDDPRIPPSSATPGPGRRHRAGHADRPVLTARERQVLELAARAMTTKQIAQALYIAEGTVRRHLGGAYKKLGAAGRLDAVNQAVAAGLIRPAAPDDDPRRARS